MTITFEPLLPPSAWGTLSLIAIVLWVLYVIKRPRACSRNLWLVLSGLMACGIAGVLFLLLNPIWLEPLPPPGGKPLLTILVDESSSMATADADDGKSRFTAAVEMAEQTAVELEQQFEVRIQSFADASRPASIAELKTRTPAGVVTDLSLPLMDGLVSDRPQGQAILLISDGVHNAAGGNDKVLDAASAARTWDAPIYTTTLGAEAQVKDIEVRVARSQELAFAGQSIPVTVEVQQRGAIGDRVDVTLTDLEGQTTTQQVRIAPDNTAEATFLVTTKDVGLFQYQIQAAAIAGEATNANNSASFQMRVVDEPVKALVLEGKPYWDSKFLLRMLTDDPSLEVDCLVRISQERFLFRHLRLEQPGEPDSSGEAAGSDAPGASAAAADPAVQPAVDSTNSAAAVNGDSDAVTRRFERREEIEFIANVGTILQDPEQLRKYQILLLGREAEIFLTANAVDNIRDWISRDGGAVVCYRGAPVAEPDQKLSRLLPVKWAVGPASSTNESRFRIQVTERGDDLSWLRIGGPDGLSKLPSLAASAATDSIKPLAVVLGRGGSSGGNSPVLTYQPYGTGKVVVVEGSGMWRWAFLSPEYRQLDSSYGILWQSLMRWLVSSGGLLPGEEIALQMDRVAFTDGESVSGIVLRRAQSDLNELPAVEILNEGGELLQSIRPIPVGDELGVYQVFAGVMPVGHYKMRLTTTESGDTITKNVEFDVRPDLREQLEVSARADLMQRIGELSGGGVLSSASASDLRQRFEEHVQQSRPVQYRRLTAWDRWWVLTGILCLWTTTWALRRRTGLI